MKTLALISQKGGSGKTTLAIHLSVCAIKKKKAVVLIDLDSQRSAFDWFQDRKGDKALAAVSAPPEALPDLLQKAEEMGADLAIVDTEGRTGKGAEIAARSADLVLIPCRPYRLDVRAILSTLDIMALIKTPFFVVFNGVQASGGNRNLAADSARRNGVAVADVMLTQRVAFAHALLKGQGIHEYEPEGKGAKETSALYSFVKGKLKNGNAQKNIPN